MITTITFNPSIDKKYSLDELVKGEVSRAKEVKNTAGGKGVNVSRVIRLLEEEVTATGFLGGKSGEFIADQISKIGIKNNFVHIKGETRSCIAIITEDLVQTEILESGPIIEKEEVERWLKVYDNLVSKSSIICSSGSLPKGMEASIYSNIIKKARNKNVKFLLDTSGKTLLEAIEEKPYFIKPNVDELKMLTGEGIENTEDIVKVIDKIHSKGIEFVLVSLGKEGAIAGFGGKKYKVMVPKIKAINPVGSGDSMVAGAAVGLYKGYNIYDTLTLAAACGTANAMEDETGYVKQDTVEKLRKQIKIREIC